MNAVVRRRCRGRRRAVSVLYARGRARRSRRRQTAPQQSLIDVIADAERLLGSGSRDGRGLLYTHARAHATRWDARVNEVMRRARISNHATRNRNRNRGSRSVQRSAAVSAFDYKPQNCVVVRDFAK